MARATAPAPPRRAKRTAPTSETPPSPGRSLGELPDPRAVSLGDLYARYCFDFLVDLAHSVTLSAIRTPLRYRTSPNARIFYDARAEFGTATNWETPAQRAELYGSAFSEHPLGGAASSPLPFDRAGAAVRKAAEDVTGKVYDKAIEALLQALELEAQNFRTAVFDPWPEEVLSAMARVARENIDRAAEILRDKGVATAFSVEPIANSKWPMEIDDAGSLLVAFASKELGSDGSRPINNALFTNLQRVTQSGARTLDVLGRFPDKPPSGDIKKDQPLGELLAAAISWQHSLLLVQRTLEGA